jgi:hypothetical protein
MRSSTPSGSSSTGRAAASWRTCLPSGRGRVRAPAAVGAAHALRGRGCARRRRGWWRRRRGDDPV